MAAQGARLLLNLVSIMALARLLAPEDFGLVAMVVAVSGFVTLFKDMGLSMATVQRAEITHAQVSTLFWVNVAMGLVLGVLLVCLATPIAWFYTEPRLTRITMVLALGIPVSGLSIQHQALLRRQMRFVALAIVDTVSMLAGIVVAITLAMFGAAYWPEAKYWALVAMPLTTAVVGAIGVWVACGWRPSGPRRGSGVRPLLSFGGYLTGVNLLSYATLNIDKILIGRVLGAFPLGLYTQAYRLLMLPLQQINVPLTAIAIPVLSRLVDSPDRFRNYYRQGIFLLTAVSMPIVVFSFVAADELVLLVLTPKWADSTVIFRALAPAGFIWTLHVADYWVYLSVGRTDRQFRAWVVGTLLTAIAYVIGVQWGAVGVALALSLVQTVTRFPMLAYCFRGTPIRLADLGAAIWRPALASIVAGLITASLDCVLPVALSFVARLIASFSVFSASYVLVGIALPGGLSDLFEAWGLLRESRTR
ncbi:MAG: lipopolysaccharide biosynthesis protein [Planctomycetes bacterium]|nr:lipopolysaccharide biosynthesis protein [Planctomycetota bacterium]